MRSGGSDTGAQVAKRRYLKTIDIFSHLEEEEMGQLGSLTHIQDVPANQPIYVPGDAADTVYMPKTGRVRISRINPSGRTFALAILEGGELFGEMVLEGAPSGPPEPIPWRTHLSALHHGNGFFPS